MLHQIFKRKAGLALAGSLLALALTAPGASAACTTGGLTPSSVDVCTPTAKAKLLPSGELIPPKSAPPKIKAVIAAANKIRTKPYVYGGGHGRWWDRGYDCSGSVSYALHGGGLIPRPLSSGELERWGAPGPGKWITVYANAGHTFAEIAGLRWDTVGDENGTGPRWHLAPTSSAGFVARHPPGL